MESKKILIVDDVPAVSKVKSIAGDEGSNKSKQEMVQRLPSA